MRRPLSDFTFRLFSRGADPTESERKKSMNNGANGAVISICGLPLAACWCSSLSLGFESFSSRWCWKRGIKEAEVIGLLSSGYGTGQQGPDSGQLGPDSGLLSFLFTSGCSDTMLQHWLTNYLGFGSRSSNTNYVRARVCVCAHALCLE